MRISISPDHPLLLFHLVSRTADVSKIYAGGGILMFVEVCFQFHYRRYYFLMVCTLCFIQFF